MKNKICLFMLVFSLSMFLAGCELQIDKINFLARPPGAIADTIEAKLMTAQDHLDNSRYEEAYNVYDEVLAEEPGNSVALYGHAESLLKYKNFRIANLIAAIVGGNGAEDLFPEDLQPINITTLREEILPIFFEDLKKIADGHADKVIKEFDVDVNFTIGIFKFIEAAIIILDTNDDGDLWTYIDDEMEAWDEYISIDKDFNITINMERLEATFITVKDKILDKFDTALTLIDEGLHYLGISIDAAGLVSRLKELQDKVNQFKERLDEARHIIDGIQL